MTASLTSATLTISQSVVSSKVLYIYAKTKGWKTAAKKIDIDFKAAPVVANNTVTNNTVTNNTVTNNTVTNNTVTNKTVVSNSTSFSFL